MIHSSTGSPDGAVWGSIPFEPWAGPRGSYPWRRQSCLEASLWRGQCSSSRSCHRGTICWSAGGSGCHESPGVSRPRGGRLLLVCAPLNRSRASPSSTQCRTNSHPLSRVSIPTRCRRMRGPGVLNELALERAMVHHLVPTTSVGPFVLSVIQSCVENDGGIALDDSGL